MRFLAAAAAALVIVVGIAACQRSGTAPSPATPPRRASVVSLAIHGPERLAPGETAQFTAVAKMSDGSTEDYTQKVSWVADPRDVLSIVRTTGVATAGASGDAVTWADASTYCCGIVRMAVLVMPPNTHRLTGRVQESGLPVQGATVSVLSGVGSGLSVATNYDGQYRLYGVAGALQIRVSKPGYVDLLKEITASGNDVLDFPEARQTQAVPSMAGSYLLTLQPDSVCSTASPDQRPAPLPPDIHRARSYAVQVTQNGPALQVAGPGPSFVPPSDRFDGRATPDGVEFLLGNGYLGYGPDNAFTAYISPTQAISYEGQVYATRVGSAVVGRLDGEIQFFEISGITRVIGACRGGNHRFSLSAAPGQTTR